MLKKCQKTWKNPSKISKNLKKTVKNVVKPSKISKTNNKQTKILKNAKDANEETRAADATKNTDVFAELIQTLSFQNLEKTNKNIENRQKWQKT